MDSSFKDLSKFQIVGFIVSGLVSIGFLIAKEDPISSVILGFVLAALTQGFDLQNRLNDSENRLLKANALSQILYRNDWLLDHVQQIVLDYQSAKTIWFDLFKMRADEAVVQCRETLRGLKEGYWIDLSGHSKGNKSPYVGIVKNNGTIKAVATGNASYWRSPEGQAWTRISGEAIRRGVKVTRIFSFPLATLRSMVDILENQQNLGVEVYIAEAEKVPVDINAAYIIFDDRIVDIGLHLGHQNRISIVNYEVEKWAMNFDQLLLYARKLDDVIDYLKDE